MIDYLNSIKFPLNNKRYIASNNSSCQTMTFGITGLNNRSWNSVQNIKNKELYLKLIDFGKELDPNFKYSSITINKNFKSYPHYDSNNIGISMIIAIGDYTGGNLNVSGKSIDVYNKIHYFDGSKELHWTDDFIGTRYSIIYFTRKINTL